MKKTVVIYCSKYGATRQYARWIADGLSCDLFEQHAVRPDDLDHYETIIYGGGLYAGGVSGIKLLTRNANRLQQKNLLLFTCGIADPKDEYNVKHIRQALNKVLPSSLQNRIQLFHLRGGIDYKKLSPVHRMMMAMLRKMIAKKDSDTLREEDRQLLATYGQSVDFTDQNAIQPIIDAVRSL